MNKRFWIKVSGVALLLVAGAAGLVAWLNVRGEAPIALQAAPIESTPQLVQRGAYLARAGNCAACHTERGGAPFAGGKGIATPFGTVFTSNLTPDPTHGIGNWSAAEFWRAMHHGRSKDGRLLYPAFPYPDYTLVTREDSDALYAYLRSVPAVQQPNRPHALRFPYNMQASLAVWRALYFSPERFEPEKTKSAEWNRGAYLVRGLGHCQACHAPRNAFGATQTDLELSGGLIPMQNWYAPSLGSPAEAGVQGWSTQDVAQLLKSGASARGVAMGPMSEVVFGSTQHLNDEDVRAMATFLRELPRHDPPVLKAQWASLDVHQLGERIYKNQCAACHGDNGEGGGDAYPALKDHRMATMNSSANLIRMIISGGFAPTTAGNPRPFGMPPFGQLLSDAEIAAVATYVRSAWGNDSRSVQELDVQRLR
ncbi:MAG TPA: cytochrome c [Ramlibacter sp.]|nr:cytochrome c [Ramlibacter sp.]